MKRNAAAMKAKSSAKYSSESGSDSDSDGGSDGSSSGGEFSDGEAPEEEGNGNGSDFSEEEDDEGEGDNYDESEDAPDQSASNIPLFKRLAEQNTEEAVTAVARERVKRRRIRDSAKGAFAHNELSHLL